MKKDEQAYLDRVLAQRRRQVLRSLAADGEAVSEPRDRETDSRRSAPRVRSYLD